MRRLRGSRPRPCVPAPASRARRAAAATQDGAEGGIVCPRRESLKPFARVQVLEGSCLPLQGRTGVQHPSCHALSGLLAPRPGRDWAEIPGAGAGVPQHRGRERRRHGTQPIGVSGGERQLGVLGGPASWEGAGQDTRSDRTAGLASSQAAPGKGGDPHGGIPKAGGGFPDRPLGGVLPG